MRRFPWSWVLMAAIVGALALGDQFLARVQSSEIRQTALQDYRRGSRLLDQGKAAAAADLLKDAYALDRENGEYELQLAAALTASGNRAAAEPVLKDVLQRDPNNGRANLLEARMMVQAGNTASAEAHYHRAAYGEWSANADGQRLSARLELVDLLARSGQKQQLLGELISLEALAPAGDTSRKQVASLFIQAGAPGRAAEIYRTLVKTHPRDGAAYEGLANAELQEGDYHAAYQAFFRALLRDPANQSLREHFLTLTTVTGLDPTPRQLTSAEKYRRSVRILDLTRQTFDQCGTPAPDAGLLKASEEVLKGKSPAHPTNEMAEQVLQLAVRFWQSAPATCRSRISEQAALGLIMKKITS